MRNSKSRFLVVLLVMVMLVMPMNVQAADTITPARYLDMIEDLADENPDDLYYLFKMFYEISDDGRDDMVEVWDDSWDALDPALFTKTRYQDFSNALWSYAYFVADIVKDAGWSLEDFSDNVGHTATGFNRAAFDALFTQPQYISVFDSKIAPNGHAALSQGFYRIDLLFKIYSTMLNDGGKDFFMFSTFDPWVDSGQKDFSGSANYKDLVYNDFESEEFAAQGNDYLIDPEYLDAIILIVDDAPGVMKGIANFGAFFNASATGLQSDQDIVFSYLDHYEFIYWKEAYTVTVAVADGSGSSEAWVNDEARATVGNPVSVVYEEGSALAFKTNEAANYDFNSWSPATPSTVMAQGTYTADFDTESNRPRTYTLTINQTGNGTVSTEDGDVENGLKRITGLRGDYDIGPITSDTGWLLSSLIGEVEDLDGDGIYTIKMNGNQTIDVEFAAIPQALPVQLKITVDGLGNYEEQTLDIDRGEVYTFESIEGAEGYTFTSIGGEHGTDLIPIGNNAFSLLMDEDKNIHVIFTKEEDIPDGVLPETGGISMAMSVLAGLVTVATGVGIRRKR